MKKPTRPGRASSTARPTRTSSTEPRNSRLSEGFIPSGKTAAETEATPASAASGSAAAPASSSQWLVPGILGVALILALFWLQSRNKAAAESPKVGQDPTAVDGVKPAGGGGNGGAEPKYTNQVPPGNYDAVNPSFPTPTTPDPRNGNFTLADATAGMPAGNTLVADIQTSMGTITCNLFAEKAPNTVANFVGLARGTREFWDPVAGAWAKRPFYDGTIFHRVIPEFMIQGGDILRMGAGGPGYRFADENVRPHDKGGLLCMANSGPNTNGSQFFITETGKDHLDGTYSIFGQCNPVGLVKAIAREPRNDSDRPNTPIVIIKVDVHR